MVPQHRLNPSQPFQKHCKCCRTKLQWLIFTYPVFKPLLFSRLSISWMLETSMYLDSILIPAFHGAMLVSFGHVICLCPPDNEILKFPASQRSTSKFGILSSFLSSQNFSHFHEIMGKTNLSLTSLRALMWRREDNLCYILLLNGIPNKGDKASCIIIPSHKVSTTLYSHPILDLIIQNTHLHCLLFISQASPKVTISKYIDLSLENCWVILELWEKKAAQRCKKSSLDCPKN